jgi:hypothetical protein
MNGCSRFAVEGNRGRVFTFGGEDKVVIVASSADIQLTDWCSIFETDHSIIEGQLQLKGNMKQEKNFKRALNKPFVD